YRILFSRPATEDEIRIGRRFVTAETAPQRPPSLWRHGHGRFNTDEQKLSDFRPLKHFSKRGYHASNRFPDPKLHYLYLGADSGHPGIDHDHAAVRRWISPIDGTIRIRGRLGHASPRGDGVRATIVSARSGAWGQWTAHNRQVPTSVETRKVRVGHIVDFVVDCVSEHSYDSFTWAPRIEQIRDGKVVAAWSSRHQFAGPTDSTGPGDPWSVYALTLLQSNGFLFVD
ncbi:MAG: hypothetical protein R3236_08635, partial [Phycisphaeraceae bacterium]|nr:hypothetical protein [Phycisphaeraceae bacterium]